jgi:hypothetical protein
MPNGGRGGQVGGRHPATRAGLLMLLHALESFFKLRDQRSFAGLETVATHDAPQKITTHLLVRIVHSEHIFGRPARDKDDDVGFGRPVHESQCAPIMKWRLAR